MSKLGLALIAITAVSVVAMVAIQASSSFSYFIQTADAQARLPNNSVRSENIVDGQVRSADIGNGEVKTDDLANSAVTTDKIADGAVTSDKLASDIQGIETHFVRDSIILEIGEQRGFTINCPSGEQVTGGGYVGNPDWSIYINAPHEAASGIAVGWDVAARNDGNQAQAFYGFVICARPAS